MSSRDVGQAKRSRWRQLAHWVASHERVTLAAGAIVVGAIWLFVELLDEVTEGETLDVDRAILTAFRQGDDYGDALGPMWFEELVRDITALGSVGVLVLLSLSVVGYLMLRGQRRTALYVVFCIGGGAVLNFASKALIGRPRPDVVPHADTVQTASFPSGHSTMAAVTFLTLAALTARAHDDNLQRGYLLFLGGLLTVIVGVSRVYLGVHWPSDVLAGWCLGTAWAFACYVVAVELQRRAMLEEPT
ncbi:MAG: phosphatase PAP2 family protein [Planctomycetota bacterium]